MCSMRLANRASSLPHSHLLEDVDDGKGSLGKGIKLKDSHGAVPDDRPAVRERGGDLLGGFGPIIETHPPVRDGVGADDLCVGVGGKVVGDDYVRGED